MKLSKLFALIYGEELDKKASPIDELKIRHLNRGWHKNYRMTQSRTLLDGLAIITNLTCIWIGVTR